MDPSNYPRIVVAGISGDSGKTIISCGLIGSFKEMCLAVSAFKKGPDYIDPAWLSLATGKPARNLDTFLMGFDIVKDSFLKYADKDGINVIEGNRGLFDGVDSSGTHSTAELAKLLEAPVVLVLDISKITRTAAAVVLGCVKLDPEVKVGGVILNRAANGRHARIVKDAIESITGLPVFGAIPKLSGSSVLPSRHLGLIMPGELQGSLLFLKEAKHIIEENVDVRAIVEAAKSAPSPKWIRPSFVGKITEGDRVKIAYFKDESFSFYYPENLEMLEAAGAELIPISPSRGILPDDLDGVYIGGGFPEMNLASIVSNREMLAAIKEAGENGLPIYAECGGLIYLSRSIEWNGRTYPLSGVLPVTVRMHEKPQGHGYCEATVNSENPFFDVGTTLRGHEFHYSAISDYDPRIRCSLSLSRGVGCFDKRDGLNYKNVFASYMHVHAASTPEWVAGMIRCAAKHREMKKEESAFFKNNLTTTVPC